MPRDVLAAHDFLAKVADKGYVLSSKILAEGMGFKVSMVHGWADGSDRYGFRMHRVGKGQWKIRRLSNAQIEEAAEIESHPLGGGWVNINNGGNAA